MTVLELSVRFGKTLIVQEMDGVEPVLYPLLRRDLIAQGENTECVLAGNKGSLKDRCQAILSPNLYLTDPKLCILIGCDFVSLLSVKTEK